MNLIFENIVYWNKLNILEKNKILFRPVFHNRESIQNSVKKILNNIYHFGDEYISTYTQKFDHVTINDFLVPEQLIYNSFLKVSNDIKQAALIAAKNIELFHSLQKFQELDIHTQCGIRCQQITRPICSIGLYIPGGSAPLLSTVLMLSIPAVLAKCKNIVLCSPPPISSEILYVASYICGIKNIFQIGGAQAIGAMAFGTNIVPKVEKIFGPGNSYVTEAKRQVNQSFYHTDIDMLAGPSEVLIIADSQSDADFVAADLLSQAEHGADSQVLLLTDSVFLAEAVLLSVQKQKKKII